MFARGVGIGRITKRLNEGRIPAPRQSPRGWAPSAIRAILQRPLYKGEIVWNQQEKVVRGGTKKRRERDEKEWVRLDAADLRIVPQDLWEKVNDRFSRTKGKGQAAHRDQDSKYLLTGMARCAHCGGPMQIVGADYHRKKGRFYGCSYYKKRGASICNNSFVVDQLALDQIILKSVEDVLTEETGREIHIDRKSAIERELSLIEAHEKNLVNAIAKGKRVDPLLAELEREESRREELIQELGRLQEGANIDSLDEARLKKEMNTRLADMRNLLAHHVASARRLLRTLLVHPLRFETVQERDQCGYRIIGTGSYLPLLENTGKSLFPSKWCPQRDWSAFALPV